MKTPAPDHDEHNPPSVALRRDAARIQEQQETIHDRVDEAAIIAQLEDGHFSPQNKNYLAATILFLTPAISVELLTGNTPLSQYLHPITFIILNVTYGGALLLIRETVVRWGKGFASVLVLASGYGMLNEAIGTKGFFAPHFYALHDFELEGFGRNFGINVPWAILISIFHAVFSIIVPLVVVCVIFPGSVRWIGNKFYTALIIALVVVSVLLFKMAALPPSYYLYSEGPWPILLILVLMATLILLAWKLSMPQPHRWPLRVNAFSFFVIGIVYVFAIYHLPIKVREGTNSPGIYNAFLLMAFVALPSWLFLKLQEPTTRGKVALAAGLLFYWLLTSFVSGLTIDASRLVAFVIVLTLLAFAWVRGGQPTPRGSAGFC